MNVVALRSCPTFQSKSVEEDKLISWKIGIMDSNGVHYENIMSNHNLHIMNPSGLMTFIKNSYDEIINIFACESDNVNF
jgi:hypothetical protein